MNNRSVKTVFLHPLTVEAPWTMDRIARKAAGFTLIEIILTLTLLGVLAATAVPKYFDLVAEGEKQAAGAALAEAQSRVNIRFSQLLLEGSPCEATRTVISGSDFFSEHLSSVNNFSMGTTRGKAGGSLNGNKTTVYVWKNDSENYQEGKLYLPLCGSSDSGMGEDVPAFNFHPALVAALMQAGAWERNYVDSEAQGGTYRPKVEEALAAAGIDLSASNINSWSYNKNGWLHWSEVNLDTVAVGQQVLVMRYNANTSAYTPMYATVTEITENGNTYKILGEHNSSSASYTEATDSNGQKFSGDKTNYAAVKAFYDQVKASSGLVQ